MSKGLQPDDDALRGPLVGPRATGPRDAAPRLLVSCRDADEAALALSGGADWIDLKQPDRGALGAVSIDAALGAATSIPWGTPLSAAGGELLDWPHSTARQLLRAPRIEYIKLGLAGCLSQRDWRSRWRMARDEVQRSGKGLAAVAYADADAAASPSCGEIAEFAIAERSPILLIDTFSKGHTGSTSAVSEGSDIGWTRRSGRLLNLFDWMDVETLADLFRAARAAGVCTGAAGSLDKQALSKIPWRDVDIVAVRGAACAAGRNSVVDPCRVAEIQAALRGLAAVAATGTPQEGPCAAVQFPDSLWQKQD